jgi:L-glyceraldehyde 3-phosphate reductase
MGALDHAVRTGKALYAGISNYSAEETRAAAKVLRELGTPCVIQQSRYSMFERQVEKGLLEALDEESIGLIVFSPLAQGLLTNRYLNGTPEDSRVAQGEPFLKSEHLTAEKIGQARELNRIAQARGQSLAQLAVTWILRQRQVTSVLIGASNVSQIEELCAGISAPNLTEGEIMRIEGVLQNAP